MLPGPGFALLIALKGAQRADQQTRCARGPQAHIHLIKLAGVGLRGQQVNDALTQAIEELRAVDGFFAVSFCVRVAVVDKHQIKIGAVAQLDTADLAIADDDKIRIAETAIGALR